MKVKDALAFLAQQDPEAELVMPADDWSGVYYSVENLTAHALRPELREHKGEVLKMRGAYLGPQAATPVLGKLQHIPFVSDSLAEDERIPCVLVTMGPDL